LRSLAIQAFRAADAACVQPERAFAGEPERLLTRRQLLRRGVRSQDLATAVRAGDKSAWAAVCMPAGLSRHWIASGPWLWNPVV
jgi:hypothetical protein